MDIVKEFFKQTGEMIDGLLSKITDNQIIKKLIIVVALFILFIIFISLISSCSHKRTYTYAEFENQMVALAQKKYANSEDLPKSDKDILQVSLQSFVDSGYIKDVQSLIKGNVACTGQVKIINNNGNYLYIPKLNCGDKYNTKTLYETVTAKENITNSGNGLYQVNNEYIFKGDKVNNYLVLDKTKYLILRVNSDGTLRVLDTTKRDMTKWDDRYNIDKDTDFGINNYVYNGINSRLKDYVENLYNNNDLIKENIKPYFATTEVCIGKRSVNDNIFDANIECSETTEKFPFTLLSASEFYSATLDTNCQTYDSDSCENYNYLTQIGSTWTITADKDTTHKVWKIGNNGISLTNASNSSYARVVTTLNGDLIVESGTGTSTDPYVIKTFNNKRK